MPELRSLCHAGCWLTLAWPGLAQADREPTWPPGASARDEIERNRLDFHPRPSDRREPGVAVYGQLGYGVARTFDCGGQSTLQLYGNRLGVRGTETLDGGWAAHFRIEHQLDGPPHCGDAERDAFWNRAAQVGLSWRTRWRLDLGRSEHPASETARMADPLDGSIASLAAALYPGPRGIGPLDSRRANGSLTLRYLASPDGLAGTVQVRNDGGAGGDPTRPGWGMNVDYRSGVWQFGAGWQRWGRAQDSTLLPLALRWQVDHRALAAGASVGTIDGRRHRAVALTLESRLVQGRYAPTWYGSVAWRASEGAPDLRQFGGGVACPLSPRTEVTALAALRREDGETRRAFELGVRHRFLW